MKTEEQFDKSKALRGVVDDLTIGFISYQWNLENPMTFKTQDELRIHYLSDPIFHNNVKSMVAAVAQIVERHLK